MRPSDLAWLTLVVGVMVYEAQAPRHELLSHALKRYSRKHPWLVRFAVLSTALHLLEMLPLWADPWVILYVMRLAIEKLIHYVRSMIDQFRSLGTLLSDFAPVLEFLAEAA